MGGLCRGYKEADIDQYSPIYTTFTCDLITPKFPILHHS